VIQIQFDNTHFLRDNGNVPSDLEQMPHLLNFIRGNGTLLTNDHTVLISHTATGILSTLTGVYPDRMRQPLSNSFRYFTPSGSTRTGVPFAYWTAPIYDPGGPPFPPPAQTDLTPEMINENGKIAPAPWVPFTRAGCDVGQIAQSDPGPERTHRLPGLRRNGSDGLALLARADAGGWDPGDLRIRLNAHDAHGTAGNIHFAYAPGEAGYVQQLRDYDLAVQRFFDRLAADGINKSNTLFLFTVDEGDHFAGSLPVNPGCDGVNVACDRTASRSARSTAQDAVRRHDAVHRPLR
jgi:hypothetical protein